MPKYIVHVPVTYVVEVEAANVRDITQALVEDALHTQGFMQNPLPMMVHAANWDVKYRKDHADG